MYLSYDGIVFDMLSLDDWQRVAVHSEDGCDFLYWHHIIDVTVMVSPVLNAANTFPKIPNEAKKENESLLEKILKHLPTAKEMTAAYYGGAGTVATSQAINETAAKASENKSLKKIQIPEVIIPGFVGIPAFEIAAAGGAGGRGIVGGVGGGIDNSRYPAWKGVMEGVTFIPQLANMRGPVQDGTGEVTKKITDLASEVSVKVIDATPPKTSNADKTPPLKGTDPGTTPPPPWKDTVGQTTLNIVNDAAAYLSETAGKAPPVNPATGPSTVISAGVEITQNPSKPVKGPNQSVRIKQENYLGFSRSGFNQFLDESSERLKRLLRDRRAVVFTPPILNVLPQKTRQEFIEGSIDGFRDAGKIVLTPPILNIPDIVKVGTGVGAKVVENTIQRFDRITEKLGNLFKKLSELIFRPEDFVEAPKGAPIFAVPPPKKKLNDPPPNNAFQEDVLFATLPITDTELRTRLSRPRRVLAIWINSGPGGAPEYVLYQPFPGASVDALHGPTCEFMNLPTIHGNVTGVYKLRFTTYEAPLQGYTSTKAVNEQLDPKEVKRLFLQTPPIISNRWSMRQVPDPTTYLNTTIIEGVVRFRMDVMKTRKVTADQLRPFLMPPIPFGYIRQPPQVVLSSGGDEVKYTVVDQQQMLNNPGGLQFGVHSVQATQEFSYNSPIDFVKTSFNTMQGGSFDFGPMLQQIKKNFMNNMSGGIL